MHREEKLGRETMRRRPVKRAMKSAQEPGSQPMGAGQARRRPRKAVAQVQKPQVPQRITRVGIALGIAVSVAACSAGVSRFDFPAFSLGKDDDGSSIAGQRYSSNYGRVSNAPAPIYHYKPNHSLYGNPAAQETSVPKRTGNLQEQPALQNDEFRYSSIERQPVQRQNLPPLQQPEPARTQYRNQYTSQPGYQPGAGSVANRGDSLSIDGKTVRVEQGDTLYSISRRMNVTVDALRNANGLVDNNIRIGQVLVIPDPNGSANASSAPRAKPAARRTPSRVAGLTPVPANGNRYQQAPKAPASDLALDVPPAPSMQTPAPQPKPAVKAEPKPQKPVRTARLTPQTAARPGNNFRWPVRGRLLAKFGRMPDGSHNDGIKVAVPRGTQVRATEDGVVAYAGSELKAYGKLILIRHANNWVSAYAHNDELLVKRGDKIKRGQVIAKAGTTGAVNQPQVHFELRKGSTPVDPLKYINGS